nr:mRNA capping enzyme catalytic domain-containing protein [Oceanusvirus sp.]
MHTVPISFCSGTAHHITDDAMKEELLRDISDRMRVRTMMREAKVYRPGAGQDTTGAYVACLQSRGNPYLLFLTRIGFCETAMYVDRKVRPGHSLPRIIVDHITFDRSLFDGTVISGEMVRSEGGEWRFLAEDLLSLRGKPISKNTTFRSRYSALLQIVSDCYRCDRASTHRIVVKRFFSVDPEGMDALSAHAEESPYGYTGYVMKSLVPGKSNWFVRSDISAPSATKPVSDRKLVQIASTVTPDVYEAYDTDSGKSLGVVCVQGLDVSKELAAAMSSGRRALWSCSWNDEFGKWMAVAGGGSA